MYFNVFFKSDNKNIFQMVYIVFLSILAVKKIILKETDWMVWIKLLI